MNIIREDDGVEDTIIMIRSSSSSSSSSSLCHHQEREGVLASMDRHNSHVSFSFKYSMLTIFFFFFFFFFSSPATTIYIHILNDNSPPPLLPPPSFSPPPPSCVSMYLSIYMYFLNYIELNEGGVCRELAWLMGIIIYTEYIHIYIHQIKCHMK